MAALSTGKAESARWTKPFCGIGDIWGREFSHINCHLFSSSEGFVELE